jgi:hypothetical protein
MPISYSIQANGAYILEEWEGTVSIKDLEEYWTKMLADPEVVRIRRTLADLTKADLAFKGHELDSLIRSLLLPKFTGREWKSALVVGSTVQFGISRQYQTFAERYSKDSIFTDRAAAEQWLVQPAGGLSGTAPNRRK